MVQRSTPLHTAHRAYTGGGARAMIDTIDDKKQMQESTNAQGMNNESWPTMESPQNYGFTSVVMPADKGENGEITDCAEGFISFMGGNRNFPVMGVMDDRRHRLREMESGDTAMYRTKDDKQQFHMTKDGGFWSAPEDKTVRMQLVKKDQQQQGQQGQGKAASGSSGQGQQQGQQKEKGQKPVRKDSTHRYVDVTENATNMGGTNTYMRLDDGKGYFHCSSDKKVWVGAEKGKAPFARLLTENGPAVNSYGALSPPSLLLGPDGNPLARVTPEQEDFPPPVIPARCFYTETTWFDAHTAADAWDDFHGNHGAVAAPYQPAPFKFIRSDVPSEVPTAMLRGSLGLNGADGILSWLNNAGIIEQAALRNIASVPGLVALMQFVRVTPIQSSLNYTFDQRTHHALIFLWGGSAGYTTIAGGLGPDGGASNFLGVQADGGTGNYVSGGEGDPDRQGTDGGGSGGLVIVGGGPSGGSRPAGRGGLCIMFLNVAPGGTAFLTVGAGGSGGTGVTAGHSGGALIFEMT